MIEGDLAAYLIGQDGIKLKYIRDVDCKFVGGSVATDHDVLGHDSSLVVPRIPGGGQRAKTYSGDK